jgi:hypothetical protein
LPARNGAGRYPAAPPRADYWDEFKPVKAHFARNPSEGVTIRFDPETLARLREQARKKGMGPTILARMWILERLQ